MACEDRMFILRDEDLVGDEYSQFIGMQLL